jgi:hypothetical protein
MGLPSADIQSIITAGAVVVGAGLGWLGNWTASRRSSADKRDERRRDAYGAFIEAAEELTRLLAIYRTVENPPAPDSTVGDNVARYVGSVSRAYVTVLLAGPRQAKEAAQEVNQRAWVLLAFLHGYGTPRNMPRDAMTELEDHLEAYISACDEFTAFAEKTVD